MEVFLLNVWEDPMFLEDPLLLNLKEYLLLLKKQKMKVQSIAYGLDLVNGVDVQSVAGLEPNKESEWFYNKPKTEETSAQEKP